MSKKEAKKQAKKESKKRVVKNKYTHIDRSTGNLLRDKDLNKKKPWLSSGGQATVEKLTAEELEQL